ncbi:VQ motif-containing protein 10 [Citrus sinensis]|uniref:VQ motif-containing protein 10-like n=1 Tax=Citrus sinensis TaxID=2711 RepID=UPI00219BB0E7|nr:VQ motif-containing protein 10-like [Citrus sinensis]KAH9723730.1 VQ motif-containing protein 10 [Citrus sinensis]
MSGVCSGGGGREPVKIVLIKTQYIETDARSFKSVVQELTGKDSGARGSNLSPASKSRKVRSNLGTKIMEGGMNINGFAGESINNNNNNNNNSVLIRDLSLKEFDRLLQEMPLVDEFYHDYSLRSN